MTGALVRGTRLYVLAHCFYAPTWRVLDALAQRPTVELDALARAARMSPRNVRRVLSKLASVQLLTWRESARGSLTTRLTADGRAVATHVRLRGDWHQLALPWTQLPLPLVVAAATTVGNTPGVDTWGGP